MPTAPWEVSERVTHAELVDTLAAHLWQPTRLVWTGVAIGSVMLQRGCPVPDVLTAQKSYTDPKLTAYEVKVSRADFQSDMRSGKWLRYQEVTNRVLFAVPKGLVDPKEVPSGAGLIVWNPERKAWRCLRAGRLAQVDLAAFEWQSLLFARPWRGKAVRDLRYRRSGVDVHDLEEIAKEQGKALAKVAARLGEERKEHTLLGVLREHFGEELPSAWGLQDALKKARDEGLRDEAGRAMRILQSALGGE